MKYFYDMNLCSLRMIIRCVYCSLSCSGILKFCGASLHQIRTRSKHLCPFLFVPPIPSIPSHTVSHHISPPFCPLQSRSFIGIVSTCFPDRLDRVLVLVFWDVFIIFPFVFVGSVGSDALRSRFGFVLNECQLPSARPTDTHPKRNQKWMTEIS